MDPRLTPFNGEVSHVSLRGQLCAARFVEGEPMQLIRPLADLCPEPGAPRARQLLMGEGFVVFERRGDWAFGQAGRDGHVGWLDATALGPPVVPTHWVAAPATHLYAAPEIHARDMAALSLGARLRVMDEADGWARTDAGQFVPRRHLRQIGDWAADPVAVAESLLGTPYLWGGNSRAGIDCSGLVQGALLACGHACPPDSDLQAAGPGRALGQGEALRRGDLVFWRGHVGWMVDAAHLLHANAHHMAVAIEPLAQAMGRIAAAGGGPVTARRRPIG